MKRKRKSKQEDSGLASGDTDETPQKKQGKKRKRKEVNSEPIVKDVTPIPISKKRRKETIPEDTEESGIEVAEGADDAKNETTKKYILFVGR